MKRKYKIMILILLIVGEVIATSFLYKSAKNDGTFLENSVLKESINYENFAIFIQKDKGSSEYIPYKDSTKWPNDYDFNNTLSYCINVDGEKVENILSFNDSERKVYVKNIKEAVYCNIYFDIHNPIPLPTCSFRILGGAYGVELVTENADSWYYSTTPTDNPDYGTRYYVPSLTTSKYYGYVKNATGTGTCVLDAYQASEIKCTSTLTTSKCQQEDSYTGPCTMTHSPCNWHTGQTTYSQVSSCPFLPSPGDQCSSGSGTDLWYDTCSCSTYYKCSDGSTCESYGCCENKNCSSYSCSDGNTYTNEEDCTSKSCGIEECKDGYEKYVINAEHVIFCHKTL